MPDIARLGIYAKTFGVRESQRNLAGLGATAKRVEAQTRSMSRGFKRVGIGLTKFVTLPLTIAGGAAVTFSATFQKALAEARAQADLTTAQVNKISEASQNLAAETGVAAEKIVEGYKFALSAGMDFAESQDIITATTKASAAGFGELVELERTTTTALNAFSDELQSGSQFLNMVAKAAQQTELEASKLAPAFLRNASTASELNIGVQELLATLGSVSETAGDANRGGRLVQQMLVGLLKPTQQAADQITTVFDSIDQLHKSIAEQGLLATLQRLQEGLKSQGKGLEDVFTSSRRLEAALNLLANGGKRYNEIIKNTVDYQGSLNQAFQDSDSFIRKLHQTYQALKNALRPIGNQLINALAPALDSVIKKLGNLRDYFNSLSDAELRSKIKLGIFIAAIGPAIAILGVLAGSINSIIVLYGTLSVTAIPAVVGAFETLQVAAYVAATDGIGAMITSLTVLEGLLVATGIGAAVLVIAAIGKAAYDSYNQTQKLNDSIDRLINKDVDTLSWQQLEKRTERIKNKIATINSEMGGPSGFGGAGQLGNLTKLQQELKKTEQALEDARPVGIFKTPAMDFANNFPGIANMIRGFPKKPLIFRPKVKVEPDIDQKDVRETLSSLEKELQRINTFAKFPDLFPNFDAQQQKIDLFRSKLKKLLDEGVDPASQKFQNIAQKLLDLTSGASGASEAVLEMNNKLQLIAKKANYSDVFPDFNKREAELRVLTDQFEKLLGSNEKGTSQRLFELQQRIRRLRDEMGLGLQRALLPTKELIPSGDLQRATAPLTELDRAQQHLQSLQQDVVFKEAMPEAWGKAVDKAANNVDRLSGKLDKTDRAAQQLGYSFKSAFEDAIIAGKNLGDVLVGLLKDIEKIILRQTITNPLGNAVGNFLGNILPYTQANDALITSKGDVVKFHPDDNILAMKDLSKVGGSQNVTVNVINNNGSQVQTQQSKKAGGGIELDVIVENKVKESFNSGRMDGVMRSNYNINRSGY